MNISGNIVDLFGRIIIKGDVVFNNGKVEAIVPRETSEECYIIPGLIDAHVHIESSMVTPSHFAMTAVKHGTVGVVSDPHEIANVMGTEGVKFMHNDAENVPLKFFFGAPSCVPATSFESSGGSLNPDDIEDLFEKGIASYLGEMMNFPGVIFNDKNVHAKINTALKRNCVIDGHAPGLTGENLEKYVSCGITTDHECSTLEEALEKISLGMKILIRQGSAARNMDALSPLLKTHPEKVMLCSDDLHPENLEKGHINLLVKKLVKEGYNLFDVLRAASVNPIHHYSLNCGLLRPGDNADFIVVDSPEEMNILQTWIDGKCVYDGKKSLFSPGQVNKVNNFRCTRISENDIMVKNKGGMMRVITARNGELLTGSSTEITGSGIYIEGRVAEDMLKIIVKERYNDGPPAVGFIKGFGLKRGAFATSVAHDSHNIIAVGTTDREIIQAVNMIVDAHGGMAVVSDEESMILKLPVAGIMSDTPVSAMARSYERLSEKVKSLGCRMDAPFMTLSFMALLVIPELKIGDRGLFDVTTFSPVSLFVD